MEGGIALESVFTSNLCSHPPHKVAICTVHVTAATNGNLSLQILYTKWAMWNVYRAVTVWRQVYRCEASSNKI